MKNFYLITILILLACVANSQEYFNLIEENKTWNVMNVIVNYSPPNYVPDTSFSTTTYKISGDSVLNSNTYKKVYSSDEEFPVDWNYNCLIREDVNNKKAWIKNSSENERLLYNFSVNVGDSILLGYPEEQFYLYVDSIINININQTLRKKYWLSCKVKPEYNETWVEGIGSNKGILASGSAFIVGGWSWLLCVSENNELIYENPNYNDCYMITTGIQESKKELFNIYPNPVKDKIYIVNHQNIKIKSIILSDYLGNEIKYFITNNYYLDIHDIPSGLYILKINYTKGVIIKKIIIL